MTMDIKPSHLRFLETVYGEIQQAPEGTRMLILCTTPNGSFFIREQIVDNLWAFGALKIAEQLLNQRISIGPVVTIKNAEDAALELSKAAEAPGSPQPQVVADPEDEDEDDEDPGQFNISPGKVKPN